jgi:Cytochrome C oxidase, cbb3-type, subunit III
MKTFLAVIGLVAILGAAAAAVFFLGGFYNVAGSIEEPSIVKWTFATVRDASIGRHATERAPASLNDPATVQAGARAYSQRGCPTCHGGPGVEYAKFAEALHPEPPDLKDIANESSPAELFWVIKNGIYPTGMPSFGAIEVPDHEIWSIAAFIKKLPSVTEEDYKAWTAPAAPAPTR